MNVRLHIFCVISEGSVNEKYHLDLHCAFSRTPFVLYPIRPMHLGFDFLLSQLLVVVEGLLWLHSQSVTLHLCSPVQKSIIDLRSPDHYSQPS